MNTEIKSVPFLWNDNFSEVAIEDFQQIQDDLPYLTCQSIGMALAKLEILEQQGAKVEVEIGVDVGDKDECAIYEYKGAKECYIDDLMRKERINVRN